MKISNFITLSILLVSSIHTFANPCVSSREGYAFGGCVVLGAKMLVSKPVIVAGPYEYQIAGITAYDKVKKIEHFNIGDRLCEIFGAKSLSTYTYDFQDGYTWTELAHLSGTDGSFIKLDNHDDRVKTLTCNL